MLRNFAVLAQLTIAMRNIHLLLITSLTIFSTNAQYCSEYVGNETVDPIIVATWGYQLLKDGKLMIDQKNIPAIQGNRGFSTNEKAELMGSFILQKVKNGGFPPTVSIEEMDSLGVLN